MNVPAGIMPGQPDGVITIHLGYGRTRRGRSGTNRDSTLYCALQRAVVGTGFKHKAPGVYQSRPHNSFQYGGRDLCATARSNTIEREEHLREEQKHESSCASVPCIPSTTIRSGQWPNYAWGLAIDLNSCVGCNACVVACQSENNIPIVGKEQIVRSREMHWLRVDTYFKGDQNNPEGPFFQPVPCMHCENAPCEPVCPVHATAHSAEGLNDGYNVARHALLLKQLSDKCAVSLPALPGLATAALHWMRNPEVTVRSRGVMEKCTYCVQRIQTEKLS